MVWEREMRRGVVWLVLMLVAGAVPFSALAQQPYPTRPIRLVLPFAAGGGTDVMTRVIAEHLGRRLGQRVIVENITGAGGTIGTERVVRATPDGYTLLLATMNMLSINPALYRGLSFDIPNDLVPVSLLLETGHLIVANPRVPYRGLQDVRAAAFAKPRTVTFASAGVGSSTHLYGELFRYLSKAEIVHVPYRGNGPALADVIAGHVDLMFDQVPNSADHVRTGTVRGLAVTTAERLPFAPDVPTAAEAGFPGLMGTSWAGMSAPRGTPPAVIAKLNAALSATLDEPEVRARFEQLGASARGSTPEEFGRLIASDLEKWSTVIRSANLKAAP
jgi:tripartite-type tricarboxylate transporter receptor subunit TctC